MSSLQPLYLRPRTRADLAAGLAAHHGDYALLAGGQTLVPLLQKNPGKVGAIIDLRHVEGLSDVHEGDAEVTLGAMVTLAEAQDRLAPIFPSFALALAKTANLPVRNWATIGGSLALFDTASEAWTFLHAYDADMILLGPEGEARRPVALGAIPPGFALTAIAIGRPSPGEAAGFAEILRRRSGGRALAMGFARSNAGGQVTVTVSGSGIPPTRLGSFGQIAGKALVDSISKTGAAPAVRAWLLAAARRALANLTEAQDPS
ncbi:FAD binding domain-containing protein [Sphingosinicella rhizophila]|uniref:FAD binding domain-containing protein n=1 Tax=Sphingosinicella rhizophila TaxID=3050082 RepID=A0ABU3Q5W1_9SPHN|nr:FAD binding domain-containing protein [Sphingosinicella sp. GR2756]MDT9598794.1 FAD binding domain-containing protein [Sphingosinicella sp. GR2756]